MATMTVVDAMRILDEACEKIGYPEFALRHGGPKTRNMTKPAFTGWKGGFINLAGLQGLRNDAEVEIQDPDNPTFCGQWVYWVTSDTGELVNAFYSNAPGGQVGTYERGQCFDVGDARITLKHSEIEKELACAAAYHRLLAFLAENGITIPAEQ